MYRCHDATIITNIQPFLEDLRQKQPWKRRRISLLYVIESKEIYEPEGSYNYVLCNSGYIVFLARVPRVKQQPLVTLIPT